MIGRTNAGPSRRGAMASVIAGSIVLATIGVFGASTYAWGETLRDEGRLLPGTTIGSVDVGGETRADAVAAVGAQLASELDRTITVVHDDRRWETSLRELDAVTNVDELVDDAATRTAAVGFGELAHMRWAGGKVDLALDPRILPDPDAVDAFVASIAQDLDRDAQDATLTWTGTSFVRGDHRVGSRVDRDAAAVAITSAFEDGFVDIQLEVEEPLPAITTAFAADVAERVEQAVADALDRVVTLTHGDATWTLAPHDLDAIPDVDPLVAAALAGDPLPAVRMSLPEEALESRVAAIAADVDAPARGAVAEVAGGELRITPEQVGAALDQPAASEAIRQAIDGGGEPIELPVETRRPAITRASIEERILVVDLAARKLSLYEGLEVVKTWPVAVGSGGSPTPTGMFTVGTKRFEPTWYNPAPNGWGSDMPATIGPGADNPLGLRALNWNRGGHDTLIRFHGTPNAASIGQAASQGCVRMFNSDVIDLYDRIPSGTAILSQG